MKKIQYPSPNQDSRNGKEIDTVVIHYTDMPTADDALRHLCDPKTQVSAHYLIDYDGMIYSLVPMEMNAWHAGRSFWRGTENINRNSIGIELQNKGHSHGMEDFTNAQIDSLVELLLEIKSFCYFNPLNLVGHSDVSPGRKLDPGPRFDWRLLARHGLTIWPIKRMGICDPEQALGRIGYNPAAPLKDRINAFQARFTPRAITGEMNRETEDLMLGMMDIIDMLEDF